MMYGAVFGGRYSREDYGAIMNYARVIPPAVKEVYVDIDGGDSAIDLTEAVGGVAYEDARIEFKFTLFSADMAERMENDLHGRRMEIVLEREPDYFYEGRLSCTKVEQDGRLYEACFTARVHPYKYERRESVREEKVSGAEKEVLLQNDRMPAMPRIQVEGNVQLVYGGIRYRMGPGIYQMPEVTLQEGLNRIRLSGSGRVRFSYRKGRLA